MIRHHEAEVLADLRAPTHGRSTCDRHCRSRPRPGRLANRTRMSSSKIFSPGGVSRRKRKVRPLRLIGMPRTKQRRVRTRTLSAETVKPTSQPLHYLRLFRMQNRRRKIRAVVDECPYRLRTPIGPRGSVSQRFALCLMFVRRCVAGGCACERRVT